MKDGRNRIRLSRRRLLTAAAGCTASTLFVASPHAQSEDDDAAKAIEQAIGGVPMLSDRIELIMPRVFPNGYTVPLSVKVASLMTDADHVRSIRVLAPKNPIIAVATFRFTAGRSWPRVSTRIRLAEPQSVLAIAEMQDGALLMTSTFVDVASNGCK